MMFPIWCVLFSFGTYYVFGQQNDQTDCECIPFYLCTNGTMNTNGAGIIDIRLRDNECSSYLEMCCPKNIIVRNPKPPYSAQIKPLQCGQRNPEGVGYKIIGDRDNEAQFGEFPWMIAIFRKGRDDLKHFYRCGGSLIHPQVVLTAAHCIHGDNYDIKIRAGEWDSQTTQEIFKHVNRDVVSTVIHPQFSNRNLANDIALLFLNKPIEIANHINTVCLPRQGTVVSEGNCFVTGWGKDRFEKDGHYQVILKRIQLPIMARPSCQNAFRGTRLGPLFKLHRSFMCAGGEQGKDVCTGDGGGPLVCAMEGENERYQQVGIVAWGIGCGTKGVPGAYVDVAHFRNWIDQQMKLKNFKTNTYHN